MRRHRDQMSFELSSCFPVKSHFSSKHHGSNDSIEEDAEDHGFVSSWEATKKCSVVNGARSQRPSNGNTNTHFNSTRSQNDVHIPRAPFEEKWYETPVINQHGNGYLNGTRHHNGNGVYPDRPKPRDTSKDEQSSNELRPEQKAQHYAGTPQRSFSPNKSAQTGVLQKLHHINRSQNGVLRRKRDVGRGQVDKTISSHSGDSLNHDSTYDSSSGQFNSSTNESDINNPSIFHNFSLNTTISISPSSDPVISKESVNNISTISSSSSHPHPIVDTASWTYQVPSNRSESQLETRSHDSIPKSSLQRMHHSRERGQLRVQFDSSSFERNAQNSHKSNNHIGKLAYNKQIYFFIFLVLIHS